MYTRSSRAPAVDGRVATFKKALETGTERREASETTGGGSNGLIPVGDESARRAMCGRLRVVKRSVTSQRWSEQPCVRPISAVHVTAGHNALRGSGPGRKLAYDDALARMGCPEHRIDRCCITCCLPFPTVPSHRCRRERVIIGASYGRGGPAPRPASKRHRSIGDKLPTTSLQNHPDVPGLITI